MTVIDFANLKETGNIIIRIYGRIENAHFVEAEYSAKKIKGEKYFYYEIVLPESADFQSLYSRLSECDGIWTKEIKEVK